MATGAVWTAIKVIGFLFTLFYRPKFKSDSEKPKSGNLQVQTSVRGARVPVVWGKRKLAGNLIWYDNFQTISHYVDSGGGKGGGGGNDVFSHYTYTVSFAFAICMGVCNVTEIWRGKDKLEDWDGVTIYNGTNDQLVDSHIASFVSRASAYRNICYVVFEDFDLGQQSFLPNFSFEVHRNWIEIELRKSAVLPGGPVGNEYRKIATYQGEVFLTSSLNGGSIEVYNATTLVFDRSLTGVTKPEDVCVYNDIVYVADSDSNTIKMLNLDGTSAGGWGTVGAPFAVTVYNDEVFVTTQVIVIDFVLIDGYIKVFDLNGVFKREWIVPYTAGAHDLEALAVYNDEVYSLERLGLVVVYDLNGVEQRSWDVKITQTQAFNRDIEVYRDVVYIANCYNLRVEIYNTSGDLQRTIPLPGGGQRGPVGIDVMDFEIYIYNIGNLRIYVYGFPPDITPPEISKDILTNDLYGLGFSAGQIDDASFSNAQSYCNTNDLLVSMILESEMSASDFLLNVAAHHNGYFITEAGKIFGNQIEPEIISNIINVKTDVVSQIPPVEVIRDSSRDIRNRIRLKYTKRDDNYSVGVAMVEDEVHQTIYGLKEGDVALNGYCTGARAMKVAHSSLRRSLTYPMKYKFKVGPKSTSILSPGAVIGITDSKMGWSSKGLRILGIEESKNNKYDIRAIEEIEFILDPIVAPSYGIYTPLATGGDPLNVLYPMVAELPALYAQNKNIVLITYGESGEQQWAGAVVKDSLDDTSYVDIALNYGSGLTGIVDSITGDTVTVTVSNADESLVGSAVDVFDLMENLNQNLCFVKESSTFFRFATATLVAPSQWRLEGFIWNNFYIATLTHEIEVGQKIGFLTYMLEPPIKEYLTERKGNIIYFKPVSFNWQGISEDVSGVTSLPLSFKAIGSKPIAPQNLEIEDYGNITNLFPQDLVIKWVSCNRLVRGLDYTRSDQISEDADFSHFDIIVKEGATVLRTVQVTAETWTYALSMWIADGRPTTMIFEIIKVGSVQNSTTSILTITFIYTKLRCRLTVLRVGNSDLPMRVTPIFGQASKNLISRVTVLKENNSNLVMRVEPRTLARWLVCRVSIVTSGTNNLISKVTVLEESNSALINRVIILNESSSNLVSRINVVYTESVSNLVSSVTVLPFIEWMFAYESVIANGIQEGGTSVANTYANDDVFDHINEVTGVPGFDFYYKHADTLEGCSKSLHVVAYYEGNSAHNKWLYIRNFDLGQWDRVTAAVDDFPDTPSKQTYHFSLPISPDYRSAEGEMWFRYYHGSSGNPIHNFFIDLHMLNCGLDLVSRVTVTQGSLASKLTCRINVTS